MHNLSYLSASRLIGLVSFYFEEVVALFVGEQFADMAEVVSKIFRTFSQATAPWVEVCSA